MEIDILQQRTANGRFRGYPGPILAGGAARTHHGHAHLGHHRTHVREVHVDHAGPDDQIGNALHGPEEHIIRGAEGVEHGGVLPQDGQQLFVGNGNEGVHVLLKLEDALIRRRIALLEAEGAGYHGHGQDTELPSDFRHHRRAPGARTPAHAGGNEHHVRPGKHFGDAVPVLEGRFPAYGGISAGTETLGDLSPELEKGPGPHVLQGLGIGVGRDEFHALHALGNHVGNGVTAAAAHPDDLNDRVLRLAIYQFKHCSSSTDALSKNAQMRSKVLPKPFPDSVHKAALHYRRRLPPLEAATLQFLAVKQKPHARGVNGIADDVREPRDIPRHAKADGLVEDFLRKLYHPLNF